MIVVRLIWFKILLSYNIVYYIGELEIMPMSKDQPMASKSDIVHNMRHRALLLWGVGREAELEPIIHEAAYNVWVLSQNLPEPQVEPGFYF